MPVIVVDSEQGEKGKWEEVKSLQAETLELLRSINQKLTQTEELTEELLTMEEAEAEAEAEEAEAEAEAEAEKTITLINPTSQEPELFEEVEPEAEEAEKAEEAEETIPEEVTPEKPPSLPNKPKRGLLARMLLGSEE